MSTLLNWNAPSIQIQTIGVRSLRTKLEKCEQFKDKLGFCPIGKEGRFQTDIASVVKATYRFSCSDKIKDVSGVLRNEILDRFKSADKLCWPPVAESLPSSSVIPNGLEKFLKLLSGREDVQYVRVDRLVNSIGQDIL